VSEQDWQATVLTALGIPLSGLMLPDARPAAGTDPRLPVRPAPPLQAAQQPVRAAEEQPGASWTEQPPSWQPEPAPNQAASWQPEAPPDQAWQPEQPWQAEAMAGRAGDPQAGASPDQSWQAQAMPGRVSEPQAGAEPEQAWRPEQARGAEAGPEQARSGQPEAAQGEAVGFPAPGESLEQFPQDAWERASQAWDPAAQSLANQAPQAPDSAPAPAEQQDVARAWQQETEAAPPRGRRQPDQDTSRPPGPRPSAGPAGPACGPIAAQDLVRRAAHGDPFARRLSRGVRRVVGASGAGEVRRTADVELALGRQLPSRRQIAVTSIRGGAGKTTVAGLTATVIAQYRQDRVLAVDADSGLGSLPLRLGVAPQRSVHDLAAAQPRSFEDVTQFLARTADGLWVLSGTAGGRIGGELDLATYKKAVGALSRYFAAIVVDCGAGLLPELQRGVLADSHSQIMVTPGTVDGAISAQGALDWQARNGFEHLLPRTVIAFVTHTPHVDADLGRAAQMMGGMPVVHLPYDRHLATGTAVESARIGEDTRAAVIRVAVEGFARAVGV
jgi:MinD-like ATPase involved in chromosome partitioning or flagellar assembly